MMKGNIICGVDIGSFKICATCAVLDGTGGIDILGSQLVPAEGLEKGRIIDGRKLSLCIRHSVEGLCRKYKIRVRGIFANIDSPDMRAKICAQDIAIKGRGRITRAHIDNLVNSCIFSRQSLNREIVHTGFRDFILDGGLSCAYPEGKYAGSLGVNIALVSTLIPTIRAFTGCIREAGLIPSGFVPSGCAQAFAFLKAQPDEQQDTEKNVLLVDIGSGLIKITLLKKGLVKDLIILPEGAQSISEDIAVKLKLSLDCAEELKRRYNQVYFGDRPLTRKFIIRDQAVSKTIPCHELNEIIKPRVDYLLQKTAKAQRSLGCRAEEVSEVIITGGAALMEGFLERAEKIFGRKVKMGFLACVKDSSIQAQSAIYATSIGLVHYGFARKKKKGLSKKALLGFPLHLANRAKQLYSEYF